MSYIKYILLFWLSLWLNSLTGKFFCPSQKLVLQKQESLTALALQCQSLEEVDLTECESLTNSICEVFSDGGGCPELKSLVLDNCEVGQFVFILKIFLFYTNFLRIVHLEVPSFIS